MKILLIKLNHIGDTLLLTPTIVAIKNRYPNAIIDLVVRKGCEGILKDNKYINNIIAVAAPEKQNRSFIKSVYEFLYICSKLLFTKYDYLFDFINTDRSRLINLLTLSKRKAVNSWHTNIKESSKRYFYTDFVEFAWGKEHQVIKDYNTVKAILPIQEDIPNLYINTDISTDIFNKLNITKNSYIVIHPTTRWSFKQWDIDKWKQIIKYINRLNLKVILTCGPDSKEVKYIKEILQNDDVNDSTYGKTSLIELAKLIENAKLFIGVDTAASHISAAVQTPSIVLFGPTDEWSWYPWNVKHELLLGDCPCKVNRKITCDKSMILPCMDLISVEDIKDKIKTINA